MQIVNKGTIPDDLTVEIEKLSNLGYGIARFEGYVIFVKSTCPGDRVKIKLTKKNKNYAYANVTEFVEPSPLRCKPICPMQNVCGACQIQFIDYEAQLKLKKEIVEDCMKGLDSDIKTVIKEVIPSPKIAEYRRKIQYPVSETKSSKRIIAGYYKEGTHELVNIKYCPIQPAFCDTIIEFIRKKAFELKIRGYIEANHTGELRHVVIRSSEYNNQNLVVLVVNSDKISNKIKELAHSIYSELENICGVSVNLNPNKTNLILGNKTFSVAGREYVEEKLCGKIFKIGAETFFQVNPLSANNIFNYVKKYIADNFKIPVILDAYAGITAFGICLADIAGKVVSVEENSQSVRLAEKIVKENRLSNIELHNMDAGQFFEKELKNNGRSFDITILDPPRKGCTTSSLDYALQLTKGKIIYVSCNPSTLARDLKYLTTKGCTVEVIQPFDMFPHTYHIENVAIINLPD